jgi:hypothetical protein
MAAQLSPATVRKRDSATAHRPLYRALRAMLKNWAYPGEIDLAMFATHRTPGQGRAGIES